jgi:Na+/melibiose symporter-like transporter
MRFWVLVVMSCFFVAAGAGQSLFMPYLTSVYGMSMNSVSIVMAVAAVLFVLCAPFLGFLINYAKQKSLFSNIIPLKNKPRFNCL